MSQPNSLTIRASDALDPRVERKVEYALAKVRSEGGLRGTIDACDAPSLDERAAMEARRQAIAARLAPCGAKIATAQVGLLAAMLKSPPETDPDKALFAAKTGIDMLSKVPAFALIAACDDYVRAGGWMPTYGEVATAALAKLTNLRAEDYRLKRVLEAHVAPAPNKPGLEMASKVQAMIGGNWTA